MKGLQNTEYLRHRSGMKGDLTNPALAAERRNVYRYVTEKDCLAPGKRNELFGYQVVHSYGAWKSVCVVAVYKYLVPLGPKTIVTKNGD